MTIDNYLRKTEKLTGEYFGKTLKGLVVWVSVYDNSGLILVHDKQALKKVFIDKNMISKTCMNRLRAGDRVTFELSENSGLFFATNIRITGHVDVSRKGIQLPGGRTISNRNVLRYGITNAAGKILRDQHLTHEELEEKLSAIGKGFADLDYVYIRTSKGEYRIFEKSSPITGDGKVDNLLDFLESLDRLVLGLNANDTNILTVEEQKEKQEKKKVEVENRISLLNRCHGYMLLVVAELNDLGFSKAEAKELMRCHGLEKALKKGRISTDLIDPKDLAKSYTRKLTGSKSKRNQNAIALWKATGRIMMENGCTEKQAKEILKEQELSGMSA